MNDLQLRERLEEILGRRAQERDAVATN